MKKGIPEEKLIDSLCSQVDIISTKPDEDENGWDRLLELPSTSQETDSTPARTKCFVQIKSTNQNELKSVQFKLSAIIDLVKSPNPCFIFFIYIENDVRNIYLTHIGENSIEKVLKRIRREQQEDLQVKLHKKTISLKPLETDKIQSNTGQEILKIINNYIPNGLNEYSQQKNSILQTIGFNNLSHSITMEIKEDDLNTLILSDLGVIKKDSIPIEISEEHETRFNIELKKETKLKFFKKISIQSPSKEYIVKLDHNSLPLPYEFKIHSKVSILGLQIDKKQIVYYNDLIMYFFDFQENLKCTLKFKNTNLISLEQMNIILSVLNLCRKDKIESLKLFENNNNELIFSLPLPKQLLTNLEWIKETSNLSQKLIELFQKHRIPTKTEITLEDINKNIDAINYFHILTFENKEIELHFKNPNDEQVNTLIIPFTLNLTKMRVFIIFSCNGTVIKNNDLSILTTTSFKIEKLIIQQEKNIIEKEAIIQEMQTIANEIEKHDTFKKTILIENWNL